VNFLPENRTRLFVGLVYTAVAAVLALAIPYLLKLVVDDVILAGQLSWLPWILAGGFAIYILRGASRYFGQVKLAEVAEAWRKNLRDKTFAHAISQSLPFHAGGDVGDRISRVHYDAHQTANLVQSILPSATKLVVTLGGTVVILIVLAPWLSLLALLVVPAALIAGYLLRDTVRPLARAASEGNGAVYSAVFQGFDQIEGLKAYDGESTAVAEVDRAGESLARTNVDLAKARAILYPTLDVTLGLVILGVLGVGAYWATSPDSTLSVGTLAAYVFYVSRALGPMRNVPTMVFGYYRSREALTRIEELLEVEQSLPRTTAGAKLDDGTFDLVFDDVNFEYPPAIEAGHKRPDPSAIGAPERQNALDGASLEIPAGDRVAVLGPSGAGKTTLARLVPRLVDPVSGEVSADGIALSELDLDKWRRRVGYVGQRPFILEGTVRQNITVGLDNLTEEQIRWAAELADVNRILDRRDADLDLTVGRRGRQLSGGQARRVALARALVRRPDILVLDQLAADLGRDQCRRIFTAISGELELSILYVGHRVPGGLDPDHTLWMESGTIQGPADTIT